jgi:hypothetical protein
MTALLIIAAYVAIVAFILRFFAVGARNDVPHDLIDAQTDCLPFVPHERGDSE